MSIKRIKLVLCIFIPFFSFFLMSHNTFAASFNSWLNIQDISKTNLSNNWITHNNANAGSYSVAGSSSLQTNRLSASANLPTQATGAYFSASGDIYIDIPSSLEGGVICELIDDFKIVPEYVSYNTTNSSLSSCSMSNSNIYMRRYTLHIETSGSIPSQANFTSFFWTIGNSSNQAIISLVGTPDDSPRVFLSGNINISIGNSPELEGLGVINQNLSVISNDLKDVQQQMSENTDTIINNQNQNTQDIIRSNQNCAIKNFFKVPETETRNGVTLTKNSDGTFDLVGTATANSLFTAFSDSVLESGIYTLSKSDGRFYIVAATQDYNSNSWLSQLLVLSANTNYVTGSINPTGNRTAFVIQILNGLTYDFHNVKVQLERGSTATSFEPYNKEICKNINQEYYDEQRQADQNISNQSTSDIDGATNQQTTNLIGTISSFVSALSSINTNGSCQLTLPFPSLLGGNQVVNPCSGADKAPAIITAASSLLLITVFVPLAFILVKMIYNEIRSFTNG